MSVFYFKEFCVQNELSAMKVNSDAVLLGAVCHLDSSFKSLLDVGTGTGTIALMLAQRLSRISQNFHIDAIDIDRASIEEASYNFSTSKWSDALSASHSDLRDWHKEYDLIVSNPPYFDNCMKTTDLRSRIARHSESMSYRELIDFAQKFLKQKGILSLIIPSRYKAEALSYASNRDLYAQKILNIKSNSTKNPVRCILEFTKKSCPTIEEQLIIRNKDTYTQEYIALIQDFYLWC